MLTRHPNTTALRLLQLLSIHPGVDNLKAQQVVKVSRHVLVKDRVRSLKQLLGLLLCQGPLFLQTLDLHSPHLGHNLGRGISRIMTADTLAAEPGLEKSLTACRRSLMDHNTLVARNNKMRRRACWL